MNAKSKNTPAPWVDPDDAPELPDEFFAKAVPMIADRPVSREEYTTAVRRGRPPGSSKVSSTIRFDGDVLAAVRAGSASSDCATSRRSPPRASSTSTVTGIT